jgi:phosphoglycolate phosphatase
MHTLHHVRAIIFDFDGTLAILNIDFSFMRDRVFELMGRLGIEGIAVREKYLLEIIDEVYQILLEKNPSAAEAFYARSHDILHEVEMKAAEKGRLISGTEATLKDLRKKGYKIGIITRNCDDAVRKIFPDIDEFCDVFVSRNSVKKVKPHPDHLTYLMKSLGIDGKDAMMVGDHIIDIQAGKQVGMISAGVLTGRTTEEEFERAGADYVLKDITEVCKILGKI